MKDIFRLVAAALCNALAGRTLYAMSDWEPWWLGHAASLTIRAFGMDLVNRSELSGERGGLLHLTVMALGWPLDKVFSILHAGYWLYTPCTRRTRLANVVVIVVFPYAAKRLRYS